MAGWANWVQTNTYKANRSPFWRILSHQRGCGRTSDLVICKLLASEMQTETIGHVQAILPEVVRSLFLQRAHMPLNSREIFEESRVISIT